MSRHFNYELDENRIKNLLQKNSMSFSEDVWNDFTHITKPIEKATKLPNFKINLAINRSVLLTVIFIILIGSFTLVLAKFVDFSSTKSNSETVREVKPEPENYKLQKVATTAVKKEVSKPTATDAQISDSLLTTNPSNAIPTSTVLNLANQTNTYSSITPTYANSGGENSMAARNAPDTANSAGAKKDSVITQNSSSQDKKQKRKKKGVETMEAKPITIELPTSADEEPELELK